MRNLKSIANILFILFVSGQELSAQWSVISGYNTTPGSILIGGSTTTTTFGAGKLLELQSGSINELAMPNLKCGVGTNTNALTLANFSPWGDGNILYKR